MFEPHGHEGLASLCHQSSTETGTVEPREQKLGDLLGNGRPTFDDAVPSKVADRCARQRQRIDARMAPESTVFYRNRRIDERSWQAICGEPHGAATVARARLVEHLAVAIENGRRLGVLNLEQASGKRTGAQPEGRCGDRQTDDDREPPC
jgi:hypothetical protein